MSDKIDEAIAATEPAPALEPDPLVFDVTLRRTGGRHVVVMVPPDLNPEELVELVGWLGINLVDLIIAANRSPIVVARGRIT